VFTILIFSLLAVYLNLIGIQIINRCAIKKEAQRINIPHASGFPVSIDFYHITTPVDKRQLHIYLHKWEMVLFPLTIVVTCDSISKIDADWKARGIKD